MKILKNNRALFLVVVALVMILCSACSTYEPRGNIANSTPSDQATEIVEKETEGTDNKAEKETVAPKATPSPDSTEQAKDKKTAKPAKPTKKPVKATKKPVTKKTPKPTKAPVSKPTKKPTVAPTKAPDKSIRLYINEIMSSNGTIADGFGKHEDWIEIYNDSEVDVNLKGYYLSDDKLEPYKWAFPNVTVKAKGHIVVWCSGKDLVDAKGEVHTSFKLKKTGEDLVLTSADKSKTLDTVLAKPIDRDKSWGRETDGGSTWKLLSPATPRKSNK